VLVVDSVGVESGFHLFSVLVLVCCPVILRMSGLSGFHLFGAPGLVRCPVIHRILSPGTDAMFKKKYFFVKKWRFLFKKSLPNFCRKIVDHWFSRKKPPIFGRK
jgi:hypothetical protein